MGNIFSNNDDDERDEFVDLDENDEPIKKIKYTKKKYEEDDEYNEPTPVKTKTRRRRSNLKNKSKANKRY